MFDDKTRITQIAANRGPITNLVGHLDGGRPGKDEEPRRREK